jgi:predicted phosphodiesterase
MMVLSIALDNYRSLCYLVTTITKPKGNVLARSKTNLEAYRDEIRVMYEDGYSVNAMLDVLLGRPETGLSKVKDPRQAIRRFLEKLDEEIYNEGVVAGATEKANKAAHTARAQILLGEREETTENRLTREVIEERARRVEAERLLKSYNERASVEDRIAAILERHIKGAPYKQRIAAPLKSKVKRKVANGVEMALLLSDAHFPEVVDPAEALGLSYGPEVTRARFSYLVERTARLIEVQGASAPVGKLTIPVLGDMLSGDIHEELSETNAMVSVEATTEMGEMLFDVGKLFSEIVPEVEMIVIPGNHPRMHKKPRAKKRYNNFEYLMGQITAAHAKRVTNFEVKVPKDIIYTHRIFDFKIGMTHGDGSKAASFAGIPFYGLKQRANANQAMRSRLGLDRNDMLMMGHFHQLMMWQEGDCHIMINGSIKGGDEYGIVSRNSAPEAVQALLTFHKERGWINTAKIPLDHVV